MASRHCAVITKKVRRGREIKVAIPFPSRGEADRASLGFIQLHGDENVLAVSAERELVAGQVLKDQPS